MQAPAICRCGKGDERSLAGVRGEVKEGEERGWSGSCRRPEGPRSAWTSGAGDRKGGLSVTALTDSEALVLGVNLWPRLMTPGQSDVRQFGSKRRRNHFTGSEFCHKHLWTGKIFAKVIKGCSSSPATNCTPCPPCALHSAPGGQCRPRHKQLGASSPSPISRPSPIPLPPCQSSLSLARLAESHSQRANKAKLLSPSLFVAPCHWLPQFLHTLADHHPSVSSLRAQASVRENNAKWLRELASEVQSEALVRDDEEGGPSLRLPPTSSPSSLTVRPDGPLRGQWGPFAVRTRFSPLGMAPF